MIGILFTVVMLVISFAIFNQGIIVKYLDTFVKSNFPTDSDGRTCGFDLPAYHYVYFANPPEIGRRVCVS